MKELERREKNIRAKVREEFMPADVNLLPKDQRKKIEEWCDQVPVLGFNSGTYDLNSDKEVLRRKTCRHNQQSESGKEWKQNHVHTHCQVSVSLT